MGYQNQKARREAEDKLLEAMAGESRFWSRRANKIWDLEGDKYYAFFHKIVHAKHTRNAIESLTIKGSRVSDETTKRDHIQEFYKSLYTEPYIMRPKLDGLYLMSMEQSQARWLERPCEEEEIKDEL